jgi:hypothetical protein
MESMPKEEGKILWSVCGAPQLAARLAAGLNFPFRDGIQYSINIPTTKKQWNIRSIDTLSPGA